MSEHHHHHHHQRDEERYEANPEGNPGYGYNQPSYEAPPPQPGYGVQYPQPGYGGYAPPQPGYDSYQATPQTGYGPQPEYGSQPGYEGYPPPQPTYGAPPQPHGYSQSSYTSTTIVNDGNAEATSNPYADEKKHKKTEHRSEFGALAAGAFALYEEHEVKVDPEHAGRHRIEESVAGAAALGSGGYAVYEHHQVRHDKLEESEKKHHHFF